MDNGLKMSNKTSSVHGDMVIVEPFPDSNRATPSFDISYDGTNDDGKI
jgi:hypothetical protein